MHPVFDSKSHTLPEKPAFKDTSSDSSRPLLVILWAHSMLGGMETPKKPAPLHLFGSVVRTRRGQCWEQGTVVYRPCPQRSSASCSANRQTKASTQDSLVAQRLRVSLAVQGARSRVPGRDDPTRCNSALLSPHSRACAPRRERPPQ